MGDIVGDCSLLIRSIFILKYYNNVYDSLILKFMLVNSYVPVLLW
jgi:hypothetical protein